MAVKKSKFSETQVAAALRECASGTPSGRSAGPQAQVPVDALDRRSIEDGRDHPLSVGKPPSRPAVDGRTEALVRPAQVDPKEPVAVFRSTDRTTLSAAIR